MEVDRGIPFLNLEGILNSKTFPELGSQINYLLYDQGFHYFVLDFSNLGDLEESIYLRIKSKLAEIFLSCGRVGLCGIKNQQKIGFSRKNLYYLKKKNDVFQYFSL